MRILPVATKHVDWTVELAAFVDGLDLNAARRSIGHADASELRRKIGAVDVYLVDDLPLPSGEPDWLERLLREVRQAVARSAGKGEGEAPSHWPVHTENGDIHEAYGLYTESLIGMLSRVGSLRAVFQTAGFSHVPDGPAILLSPKRIASIQPALKAAILALAPGTEIPVLLGRDRALDFARIIFLHELGHHVLRADDTNLSEALADFFAEQCLDEELRLLHCLLSWHLQPYVYSGYHVLQYAGRWLPSLSATLAYAFSGRASALEVCVRSCYEESATLGSIDLTFRHLHGHGARVTVFLAFAGLAWRRWSEDARPPLPAAQLEAVEDLLDENDRLIDAGRMPDAAATAQMAASIRVPTHSVAARLLTSEEGPEALVRFVLGELLYHERWMRETLEEAVAMRRLLQASPQLENGPWRDGDPTTRTERLDYLSHCGRSLLPPENTDDVAQSCRATLDIGVAIKAIDSTAPYQHDAVLRKAGCGYSEAQLAIRSIVAASDRSKETVLKLLDFVSSGSENVQRHALDELGGWKLREIAVGEALLPAFLQTLVRAFQASSSPAIRRRILQALARDFAGPAKEDAREALESLKGSLSSEEEAEGLRLRS